MFHRPTASGWCLIRCLLAIRVWLCVFALLTIGRAQTSSAVPVLTVCEVLNDLSKFDGRTIVVVGRFSHTDEGSWVDEDCPGGVTIDGRSWPTGISTSYTASQTVPAPTLPKGFHWNRTLIREKLGAVKKTTTLRVIPQYHYSDE